MNNVALSNCSAVSKKLVNMCGVLAGWRTDNYPVIEAQFILEKGWQYWADYPNVSDFNFGNTKINLMIDSEITGLVAYVATIFNGNPAIFTAFSDAMRTSDGLAAVTVLSQVDWAVPPYGQTIIDLFDEIVGKHVTSGKFITVQPGESLWQIGERWGMGLRALMLLNPQIKNPNLVHPGEEVRIRA